MKKYLISIYNRSYNITLKLLYPINWILIIILKNRVNKGAVLHISSLVHIAYYTTEVLRDFGIKADYLAISESKTWNKSDFRSPKSKYLFIQAYKEFMFFWRVMSSYEIFHLHFAYTMSKNGWELPILKKMGRKIVIHYRGCEIRDVNKNKLLHPKMNICQNCDYGEYCISPENVNRVSFVSSYGDKFLVTTPDMLDFVPDAMHMPFFAPPDIDQIEYNKDSSTSYPERPLRILHWTNHPGIEGTDYIKHAIESLKTKGYAIEFVFLTGVSNSVVMKELSRSDLTIGKMKMGYYANSQIEALAFGVPAITYVRPEFMTEEIENSGLIISSLDNLENTLEYYLNNPFELEKKSAIAKTSINQLHNNQFLAKRYLDIYQSF